MLSFLYFLIVNSANSLVDAVYVDMHPAIKAHLKNRNLRKVAFIENLCIDFERMNEIYFGRHSIKKTKQLVAQF